ncbi:HpcH/HpaI aldolase/citrate lyase family protein [Sporomusa acidovorans]|uniref:Citrate lyase subunit beta n=1 Tax=Sporomusa acidovorans (strain ATCC 49682 / DSM 3132 / Mol) TaxID=1123286 RepID=A0ABZ3J8Q6_SPOA4|nr:CoA ester lyase [Sporomusa acidovorans]OZC16167.1 citrate lyase subunit beta [Sporomusa acidovorans DSM 3132]SDE29717.1 citrate lyase subunit beta / citryl-CoA lyase [Sporomusa acidovorans]
MGLRRTLLFIPGNNSGMLQNAGILGADALIFDLEDAVAPQEKDAARLLVGQALRTIGYGRCEKIVRINPLDVSAEQDIRFIVPCHPDALMIPKVNTPEDIRQAATWLEQYEAPDQKPVKLIALIETPLGIANCFPIASAHQRLVAMALGAEDYTASLGVQRTKEGREIFTARTTLVNAAAAAGIQSIDTPFTDMLDEEGLVRDVAFARHIGFKGKLVINPRHIDAVHEGFSPSAAEIMWAHRVVAVIKRAAEQGTGAVSLDGKMIDKPIVERAERVLQLAQVLGLEGRQQS